MAKVRFDWDSGKDAENQGKHGVSFSRAQYAFADPRRVFAIDFAEAIEPLFGLAVRLVLGNHTPRVCKGVLGAGK